MVRLWAGERLRLPQKIMIDFNAVQYKGCSAAYPPTVDYRTNTHVHTHTHKDVQSLFLPLSHTNTQHTHTQTSSTDPIRVHFLILSAKMMSSLKRILSIHPSTQTCVPFSLFFLAISLSPGQAVTSRSRAPRVGAVCWELMDYYTVRCPGRLEPGAQRTHRYTHTQTHTDMHT